MWSLIGPCRTRNPLLAKQCDKATSGTCVMGKGPLRYRDVISMLL